MNLQNVIKWSVKRLRRDQLFRLFKVLGNESVVPKKESDPDESEGNIYP